MNKEIGRKWLKQAQHDLLIAERNIEIEGYDVASFLVHQSVEKLLKSIFAARDMIIPRSHHILELARELSLSDDILSQITDLSSDYTVSRYPDVMNQVPFELYSKEIAVKKVNIGKQIFELLLGETDELT